MKYPPVLKSVKQHYTASQKARSVVMQKANDALRRSKRAIFAFHRDDVVQAKKLLKETNALFVSCEKIFKTIPKLSEEGSYRAALEEYAEALLYQQYLEKGTFASIPKRAMAPGIYLAGLCDTTGEIVRFALREATEGRPEAVEKAYAAVELVVNYLYELDLTGYLRTKFDQSKKNLSRLEQMRYELQLRK